MKAKSIFQIAVLMLFFIILANISSEQAEQGIELIMAELMQQILKTNAK